MITPLDSPACSRMACTEVPSDRNVNTAALATATVLLASAHAAFCSVILKSYIFDSFSIALKAARACNASFTFEIRPNY